MSFASRICAPMIGACCLILTGTSAFADVITFDDRTWDFGNGVVLGWQPPSDPSVVSYAGTTELADGAKLTIRVTNVGSVTHLDGAIDHLQLIPGGNGTLLNFNQNSATAENVGHLLQNYVRVDFEFTEARYLTQYWHDIDNGHNWDLDNNGQPDLSDWTDMVYAESHDSQGADPGTGTQALYALGSNLELVTRFGWQVVRPEAGTLNVDHHLIDDIAGFYPNTLQIGFDGPVTNASVYYWNDNPLANFLDVQRILLGNIDVSTDPLIMRESTDRPTVPEPSSLLLGVLGTAGIGWVRRRSQKIQPVSE